MDRVIKNKVLRWSAIIIMIVISTPSAIGQSTQVSCCDTLKIADSVYVDADEIPEFTDGYSMLFEYVYKHLEVFPLEELRSRVLLQFIVTKEGDLVCVEVIGNEKNSKYAENLIFIFENMPAWIPGKINKKAVNVKMQFPFRIHIRE